MKTDNETKTYDVVKVTLHNDEVYFDVVAIVFPQTASLSTPTTVNVLNEYGFMPPDVKYEDEISVLVGLDYYWRILTGPTKCSENLGLVYNKILFGYIYSGASDCNNHKEPNSEIFCYRFCRLPFGLICSPAMLNSVISHHLETKCPTVNNSFYVDDYISGFDDLESGEKLINTLTEKMTDAGFCMHKFKSNHPKLLNGGGTTSVLGVPWNLDSDNLYFAQKFSIDENSTCFTKRSLLKFIGSIFDPLGMISPLTVSMRLLFRNLWKEKYDWDQPLPKEFAVMIEKFYELYKCLKNLSIPRFLGCLSTGKVMLFGFCDASMQAIGCVFYVVSCFESYVASNFLCSKARLAPLKETITIPRLELLSCLLLINLYVAFKHVLPEHTLHCYSDSMCALSWIKGVDKTWKPYIQSRVDIIRRCTDISQWYFMKGESNPADLITRFDDSLKFETFKRWHEGPMFLRTLELPVQPSIFLPDESEEIKCLAITSSITDPIPSLDIERFSKYTIVIRTIARILR